MRMPSRIFLFIILQVTQTSVVCGPGEVSSAAEAFHRRWGIKMHHVEDVEDSFLSS